MGRLLALLSCLCAGCFVDVDFSATRFSCEQDGECPGGYACLDGVCSAGAPPVIDAGDQSADASVELDAAPPIDAALACGFPDVEIQAGVATTGTTVGGVQVFVGSCNETAGVEVAHRLVLAADAVPATVNATTDLPGTGYDAVLYARSACTDAASELACSDAGQGDTIEFAVTEPGEYFFIVDSHNGGSGNYELLVTLK